MLRACDIARDHPIRSACLAADVARRTPAAAALTNYAYRAMVPPKKWICGSFQTSQKQARHSKGLAMSRGYGFPAVSARHTATMATQARRTEA